MPIDKSKYPHNWNQISIQVRTEANWQCEWCGLKNKAVVQRTPSGPVEILVVWNNEKKGHEDTSAMRVNRLREFGLTKIVLTVAHLDRDTTNNHRSNLAALCQKCHLGHDKEQHAASRRYGRNHREHPHQKIF
jgi:hypothetical protein